MMNKHKWEPVKGEIMTKWVREVSPDNPLPEYPRPQLKREKWISLNGLWNYTITSKVTEELKKFDSKILVPFPIESALSGVKKKLKPNELLWYQKLFSVPLDWKDKRILLNFGAVDWECKIFVNQRLVGEHRGGYVPFSFDITEYIDFEVENELIVSVWDPTDKGGYPRGKQKLKPYGVWYTPVSGIWQTVWLEPVPYSYIKSLKMIPDIDNEILKIKINLINSEGKDRVKITIKENNNNVTEIVEDFKEDYNIKIPNPKLWSPSNPFLYDIIVSLEQSKDSIQSYFGMRKISIMEGENGHNRIALNNEILFQYGPLDQGFWPDGIYTAPTDDALKYDIEITKELGFNMIRKHVKVEPARWYYWCDKLGILVWQDMPTGGNVGLIKMVYGLLKRKKIGFEYKRKKDEAEEYHKEFKAIIDNFFNHPSIVVWVPHNEGWGQFDTAKIVTYLRELDPDRLIDPASGWFDHGLGDIADCHHYTEPCFPGNLSGRVAVCGEFGGLGLKIVDHSWKKKLKFVYKRFSNAQVLYNFYSGLILKLKKFKKEGLGAAVYTQTTDVEGEINGLLTYDREIVKMNQKKLTNLNLSIY